jgi:NAD(P)H dehydrogenase (quinone)
MSIVITGASGQLGRATAEALLEKVPPGEVILVTRHPEAIADLAEAGAVVRHGDFDDAASLPAAFAGAERMLLISTDVVGTRVAQHQAAIDAAAQAGVRLIAYTSIVNPSHSNPVAVAAEHRATEELIRAAGLGWIFLRNGIYAEQLIPAANVALTTGVLLSNEGQGRTAYVSRDDCAAVAAEVLASREHDGRAYDITGPEALGPSELAVLYTEAGEAIVQAEVVDDATWIAAMTEAGMPPAVAEMLSTFGIGARRGYLAAVSTTVEELLGRPPRSVIEVLRAHRAELAPAP